MRYHAQGDSDDGYKLEEIVFLSAIQITLLSVGVLGLPARPREDGKERLGEKKGEKVVIVGAEADIRIDRSTDQHG